MRLTLSSGILALLGVALSCCSDTPPGQGLPDASIGDVEVPSGALIAAVSADGQRVALLVGEARLVEVNLMSGVATQISDSLFVDEFFLARIRYTAGGRLLFVESDEHTDFRAAVADDGSRIDLSSASDGRFLLLSGFDFDAEALVFVSETDVAVVRDDSEEVTIAQRLNPMVNIHFFPEGSLQIPGPGSVFVTTNSVSIVRVRTEDGDTRLRLGSAAGLADLPLVDDQSFNHEVWCGISDSIAYRLQLDNGELGQVELNNLLTVDAIGDECIALTAEDGSTVLVVLGEGSTEEKVVAEFVVNPELRESGSGTLDALFQVIGDLNLVLAPGAQVALESGNTLELRQDILIAAAAVPDGIAARVQRGVASSELVLYSNEGREEILLGALSESSPFPNSCGSFEPSPFISGTTALGSIIPICVPTDTDEAKLSSYSTIERSDRLLAELVLAVPEGYSAFDWGSGRGPLARVGSRLFALEQGISPEKDLLRVFELSAE